MADNDDEPVPVTDKTPNPLIAIAVGMAVFFTLAALVIGQS